MRSHVITKVTILTVFIDCQDLMMSPCREKGITKQGYLTKAPFHGESNGTPGAKVRALFETFANNFKSVYGYF